MQSNRITAQATSSNTPERGLTTAGRSGLIGLLIAASIALFSGFGLHQIAAASNEPEAILLTSIDPRFSEQQRAYMGELGLDGKYWTFEIKGGPGVLVANSVSDAQQAHWQDLIEFVKKRKVKKIVALAHRTDNIARMESESQIMTAVGALLAQQRLLQELRARLGHQLPEVEIETAILGIDGRTLLVI
jgi:hypothetical protein